MDITFSNKKLMMIVNDDRKMLREFGKKRMEKVRLRLSQLRIAKSLEDLRHLPGNFHELKGNRKGQWACDLDQPYRLIFTPHEDPIPKNQDGQFIWAQINGVAVIEVVNYHKES